MKIEKFLGKITQAEVGHGGYQDAMIGLTLTFEGPHIGCSTHKGAWSGKRSESAAWSEEDRLRKLGDVMLDISDLLTKAKVKSLDKLVGIPVEVELIDSRFHSFRILTEVL